MRTTPVTLLVVMVGLLLVSVPVTAHHSAAAFDAGTEITLKGTVTEWLWSNPHCLLQFDVTEANGQVVHWVAETQNPRTMSDAGWAKTSIKPGDQVTLTVYAARNGRPFARVVKVVLPGGQELKS